MSKASFVLGAALRAAAVAMAGAALLPAAAVAQQTVSQAVGKHLKDAQAAIGRKQWDTAHEGDPAGAGRAASLGVTRTTRSTSSSCTCTCSRGATRTRRSCSSSRWRPVRCLPASARSASKTLAQLHFRAGNYGKAIQVANDYLKAVPGDREMQMMVAQGYYQQKNYKGAIAAAQKLAGGGQPSEDILQLILRSNYELGDKAGTAKALEQLLKYYPTPETWKSLLKTYFNQAKGDDEKLALYRLSQDVGALEKSSDYFDMAEALIVEGFPAEGRRVIEAGVAAKVVHARGGEPGSADTGVRRQGARKAIGRHGRGRQVGRRRAPRARTCIRPGGCTSARATIRRPSMRCARHWPRAASATPTTPTCCSGSRSRAPTATATPIRPSRR